MTKLLPELAELLALSTKNCTERGALILKEGEVSSSPILSWLSYLRTSEATGTADCLLDGAISAIREGVACVVLGLVRPALNSLRLQIDLSLAWLYFKDHPVEWQRVQATANGFKMKADLIKYLSDTGAGYAARIGILNAIRTRSIEDPYRLLSAHIHGQSEVVLPTVGVPKDIVAAVKYQDEYFKLQAECAEFVGDIFWSVFCEKWSALPDNLKSDLVSRFKTPAQRVLFFAHVG